MIRFFDPRPREKALEQAMEEGFHRVTSSGQYLLGVELESFEAELAEHEHVRQCVGVGSGLAALHLALKASEIGPGDEVIVPSNTFIATWLAVTQTGAVVVPVDPDPETFCLHPDRVDDAMTGRTAAVIPVNLYGRPVDLASFERLASRRGILLLIDGAQSLGSRFGSRRSSSYGHATATSFYPGKNLGALGDGGAVLTNDRQLADRVRLLRNYGAPRKYEHTVPGWNSRLDELQSAFLRAKLPYLDSWNEQRREQSRRYTSILKGVVRTPPDDDDTYRSSWHLYVIRHNDRESLVAQLATQGIETGIHYPTPPHRQGAYAGMGSVQFPIAESLATTVVSLPIGPHLDFQDVQDVAAAASRAAAKT